MPTSSNAYRLNSNTCTVAPSWPWRVHTVVVRVRSSVVVVVVVLLRITTSIFVRPSKYSMFRQLLSLGIPITRDGRRLGGSAANNIQVISALALKDDTLSRSHTFFFKQLDSVLNHGRRMNTLRVQMLQDRFLDACRVYSLLLGREFGGWRRVGEPTSRR